MTVAELGARMSSREFSEWAVLYAEEPFDGVRGDVQAGIVAATIANANRDPRKGKPFNVRDFMPFLKRTARPEDVDGDAVSFFKGFDK